ncbi:SMP-30/gluconolactonase/LRE family protein [Piscinibacter sp. HJYY11]|uniref:SMP-30/gluconolactonase/LRE family protein n=1 Tax=Piscinibacter sp. HJYY11 TaxID=2801333 RepID=UPI00191FA117|nr:SMP-30/gluconolactonase/LRE family protein [Piscinibacter sp. HJYY11]MBL0727217.1 SMP-30/gluconolactonase/LRE family protein [Piscinibacter sp. HJYY11]
MAILCAQSETVERRQLNSAAHGPLVAFLVHNRVGESPVWDLRHQCLWWIDVRAQQVLRLDPVRCHLQRWTFETPLGALCLLADGRLGVAMRHHAVIFTPESGERCVFGTVEADRPGNRLNDGKVSPSGRWWLLGSMDDAPADKQPLGCLYRLGVDGSVARLHEGLTVANGIAWSLDARTLYFSDSHAGLVWRAAWNEEAGEMGPPSLMATLTDSTGRPDGAVVDASGAYWSAGVSAGRLNRFIDGALRDVIELPCRAPTMPCFGGEGLQELYVTSLVRPQWSSDREGLDGALYRLASPASGSPPALWAFAAA